MFLAPLSGFGLVCVAPGSQNVGWFTSVTLIPGQSVKTPRNALHTKMNKIEPLYGNETLGFNVTVVAFNDLACRS